MMVVWDGYAMRHRMMGVVMWHGIVVWDSAIVQLGKGNVCRDRAYARSIGIGQLNPLLTRN